ncbi:hypothetical protein CC1G_04337 [Coprinopsis cinerea okayama7|uniref:Secreted protein n=1 Tax=Coprinopsis cinerea (strain Okayama-7 / 130 / ATCC MYA-4618 / FGSC 9003) TaxID=240176 RepID=A8N0N4_COPC7|nr:hypothetical protein CC1G_04337 [Coprinopsis cinerea okayama7\|eukprot:XP_001828366.1 hypothetical protein CC1G_04337 [Coprinopsis cinerea okayama7\
MVALSSTALATLGFALFCKALSIPPVKEWSTEQVAARLAAIDDDISTAAAPDGFSMAFSARGTGCSSSNTVFALSPDKTSLTVRFSNMKVQSGAGIPADDRLKTCEMTLNTVLPRGWSFGLSRVETRGFTTLGRGLALSLYGTYDFKNAPVPGLIQSRSLYLPGPATHNDATLFQGSFDSILFSACGDGNRSISVEFEENVRAQFTDSSGTGAGSAGVDSVSYSDSCGRSLADFLPSIITGGIMKTKVTFTFVFRQC